MTSPAPVALTPEIIREHGLTPDEYEKIKQLLGGREPTLTELGIFSVMWSEHCSYKSSRVHLKRLPTRSKLRGAGAGRERRHHRHRRRLGLRLQDRVAQSSIVYRAVSGRRHRRRRNPARHFHHGRAAGRGDGFAALRPDLRHERRELQPPQCAARAEIHKNHSVLEGVVSGIASYGNCFGVPNLGGETKFEPCYSGNPLVNAFALGLVRRRSRFFMPRPPAKAIRSSTSAQRPGATASTAPPWPARNSAKPPKRSGPTCRSAIRSWKSCCSKPASKPCRPARSSAFRTWAPPG